MNTLMIVVIIVMIVGVVLILILMCLCVEYCSTWKHHSKYTVYQEIFVSLNFPENFNFNNFTKIFSQMIHVGNIKGVAWQYFMKFYFVTE